MASRKRRQEPVPHHRVDAQLHQDAKEKADEEGVSLSQVAVAGLNAVLRDIPAPRVREYRRRHETGELSNARRQQNLPPDTAALLQQMKTERDPRLSAYLVALYEAGWSVGALASCVGTTRQSVHGRLQRFEGRFPSNMPPVPEAEWTPTPPGDRGRDYIDWAIWVDRETYAIVAQWARAERTPMFEIMEDILADYIDGALTLTGG